MKDITKYIGLDISKESIAVAIADSGREAPRFYGMIPNTPEAIRKRVDHVGKNAQLEICYEAGATGGCIISFLAWEFRVSLWLLPSFRYARAIA
ncbi:hypothetical protein [Aneurinibacillus migulanus]|uniref:hypothetical protein n=1 Tax=Aneurinibacillus migulanus TaxID=47500 RepID=UPI000AB6216E|nr:hypothetical protein [Aneurinibacillus migulanus]